MPVAEDHRPPRADEIDVAVVVEIDQPRAFGFLNEERISADTLPGAHGRIHAAGKKILRAFKGAVGARGVAGEFLIEIVHVRLRNIQLEFRM